MAAGQVLWKKLGQEKPVENGIIFTSSKEHTLGLTGSIRETVLAEVMGNVYTAQERSQAPAQCATVICLATKLHTMLPEYDACLSGVDSRVGPVFFIGGIFPSLPSMCVTGAVFPLPPSSPISGFFVNLMRNLIPNKKLVTSTVFV
jgi:hypothetical protein